MTVVALTFPPSALPPDALAMLRHSDVELRFAPTGGWSNLEPADSPHTADADVIFGQPTLGDLRRSRAGWVQLTSAGYARYDTAAGRAALGQRTLTTSSTAYAAPCAESALGMLLGASRRLAHALVEQPRQVWHGHEHRAASSLLRGSRVLLLGWGAIARELARLLEPFEVELVALRRHATGDEAVRCVTRQGLDDELAVADFVVSTLPGGPDTERLVDAALLSRLPGHAVLVNIGRGTVMDHDALADALEQGRLGGAWLDVTEPEPLPPGHRLWTTPNCWISPHSSGGRADEHAALVRHFLDNLGRWERGEELADRR